MIPTEKKVARAAITAGLSAMMALGTSVPALATENDPNMKGVTDTPVVGESANPEYERQVTGESRGDTKLYIIGQQDDLTTSEGAADEQVKVSIPVAIHYVADSKGNLTGPSDNVVKFVNHTITGPVHISKIAVDNNGSAADISLASKVGTQNDRMSFNIQPVQGQSDPTGSTFVPASKFDVADYVDEDDGVTLTSAQAKAAYEPITQGTSAQYVAAGSADELGYYSTTTTGENQGSDVLIDPQNVGDWNIAQKHGALGLNNLTGKIGGFSQINAGTDYQAGAIHWIVRSGTRAQADQKDCTVTLHYNANIGDRSLAQNAENLLSDQAVQFLTYTKSVADADSPVDRGYTYDQATAQAAALKDGSAVAAPLSHTNSNGSVTSSAFIGWSLDPKAVENGSTIFRPSTNFTADDVIQAAKGTGSETDLKNGVVELYAIYQESTTTVA